MASPKLEPVVLTDEERQVLERVGAAAEDRAGPRAAVAGHPGLRGWRLGHRCCR